MPSGEQQQDGDPTRSQPPVRTKGERIVRTGRAAFAKASISWTVSIALNPARGGEAAGAPWCPDGRIP